MPDRNLSEEFGSGRDANGQVSLSGVFVGRCEQGIVSDESSSSAVVVDHGDSGDHGHHAAIVNCTSGTPTASAQSWTPSSGS